MEKKFDFVFLQICMLGCESTDEMCSVEHNTTRTQNWMFGMGHMFHVFFLVPFCLFCF